MTLTNILKVGDVKGITAYADSSPAPIADVNYNNSWKYTKTITGADKFNIYFFGNQVTYPVQIVNLHNFWAIVTMGAFTTLGEIPFLVLYTLPDGINDSEVWYKSKISYTINPLTPFFAGERVLLYAGKNRTSQHDGIRHLKLDQEIITSYNGLINTSETVNLLSVHSNSTNPAGFTCNIHNVGWSIHTVETNILLN